MTSKQKDNYNKMLSALKRIAKYQTLNQLKRNSSKDWALAYDEALEMSYENILQEAKMASNRIKPIY